MTDVMTGRCKACGACFYESSPGAREEDLCDRCSTTPARAEAQDEGAAGWIVGNGEDALWRAWDQGIPVWVDDRAKATRYARREDAEAVHAEDEDAWCVKPYPSSRRPDTAKRTEDALFDLCLPEYSTRRKVSPAEPAEARVRELEERVAHLTQGCAKQNDEVCQALGRALGYPAFSDDQVNFPGATEADGVCVGEHVAESLADEAARRITTTQAQLAKAKEALRGLLSLAEMVKEQQFLRKGIGTASERGKIILAALQEAGEVG